MADQQKYVNKLRGKRVLIIGGSSGIGFGVAEACLEYECTVHISSSNSDRVQNAVERLKKAYPSRADSIHGLASDLGDDNVDQNLQRLFNQVGDLEHVVYTAGDRLAAMPVDQMSLESVKKAGQIRFFAPLLLAKHLPRSTESYTITSGTIALKPIPQWAIVGGYAAGQQAMTRNLALDLAPVRVNLVTPGAVDTEMWDYMGKEKREQLLKSSAKDTLTGRVGRVEDIVEGFLAFMRDGNCTGTNHVSDGGKVIL